MPQQGGDGAPQQGGYVAAGLRATGSSRVPVAAELLLQAAPALCAVLSVTVRVRAIFNKQHRTQQRAPSKCGLRTARAGNGGFGVRILSDGGGSGMRLPGRIELPQPGRVSGEAGHVATPCAAVQDGGLRRGQPRVFGVVEGAAAARRSPVLAILEEQRPPLAIRVPSVKVYHRG
jgi:hypothetical protein